MWQTKGDKDRNIRSSQRKEKNATFLELVGESDREGLIEKDQRGFDNSKKIEEENEKISEMISNEIPRNINP